MKISDVRIKLVSTDDSKLKAFAAFTIDEAFAVHDVKVIDGKDGLFISMPNKKLPNGERKDIIHPINTETRDMLQAEILKAYEDALKAEQSKLKANDAVIPCF